MGVFKGFYHVHCTFAQKLLNTRDKVFDKQFCGKCITEYELLLSITVLEKVAKNI